MVKAHEVKAEAFDEQADPEAAEKAAAQKSMHARIRKAMQLLTKENGGDKRNEFLTLLSVSRMATDEEVGNMLPEEEALLAPAGIIDFEGRDGILYAKGPTGEEVPFQIKGCNWVRCIAQTALTLHRPLNVAVIG